MTEQKCTANKNKVFTGEVRRDLKLIQGSREPKQKRYWMLFDPLSDSYYRLTENKKQIIAALDHNYLLEDFIKKLEALGITATMHEVVETLKFLQGNMLIMPGYGAVEKSYKLKQEMRKKSRLQMLIGAITYLRFPPLRPEKFFKATAAFIGAIFNRWFLGGLILLAIIGYIALIKNWNNAATMLINSLTWSGMVKYSFAILFMKVIHECSHAYVAATYGIRVRSIGISIIFFLPRVCSDLTDSWRLPRKKRLNIDAAGIYSEIIIGGLAAMIWAIVPPGALHSTMFFIFSVSVLNTILVNGNPFIRFDGYYILMDITNIDNLLTRSNQFVRDWWRSNLFGLPTPKTEKILVHKKYFLFCFGVGAYCYRLFLYTTIIVVIYNKFTKPVALVLLMLEIWSLILLPLYRETKYVSLMKNKIKSFKFTTSAIGLVILILIVIIPLPWQLSIPCEVRSEKSQLITVSEGGYIQNGMERLERKVKYNECLLSLKNPTLDAQIKRAELDCLRNKEELEQFRSETKLLPFSREKFEVLKANSLLVRELKQKQQKLTIKAPIGGQFVAFDAQFKPGRWLSKGTILGEILTPEVKFYAYLPANQVDKLKIDDKVTILLNGELVKLKGKVSSINPLPVKLRSSPLIQTFGGRISCHYSKDEDRFIPNIPHYKIIINLTGKYNGRYGRVGVMHIRKYTSIAWATLQYALKLIQQEFSF
jgi:putative peptide zinc metalloprotease protein